MCPAGRLSATSLTTTIFYRASGEVILREPILALSAVFSRFVLQTNPARFSVKCLLQQFFTRLPSSSSAEANAPAAAVSRNATQLAIVTRSLATCAHPFKQTEFEPAVAETTRVSPKTGRYIPTTLRLTQLAFLFQLSVLLQSSLNSTLFFGAESHRFRRHMYSF